MKKFWIFGGWAATLLLSACSGPQERGATDGVERIPEVEALLAQMTVEEKVGQMAQLTLDVLTVGENEFVTEEPLRLDSAMVRKALVDYGVGSILNTASNKARTVEKWHEVISELQRVATEETRLGIPVLYGVDAIHGTTYTVGATFFPQQIGQAATWNRELVRKGGEITAYETRASGIPWNFSPVLDMGRDPRFARMWETFGEDVHLVSELGVELVKGYEGENNEVSNPFHVASCLKHYLGYGTPWSGKDRTPAHMSDTELRERHLPAFEAAIEAGAHTVMVNSGLINGVPVHASYELLTGLLKEELGFQGLVVTDWADINNLHSRDRVAVNHKEAVKLAINAGIDMSMIPYSLDFCDDLVALVNEGEVAMARIDDAVRRILNTKHKLGLFERPVTHYEDYPLFGSAEFEAAAYQAAQESMTLLKNEDDILPLPTDVRILVAGPNAHTMRALNGGWSYTWQGRDNEAFTGDYATILDAIRAKVGAHRVEFVEGVRYVNAASYWVEEEVDVAAAVRAAARVDYIVLALGENSYTEKPGDLHDLTLSEQQLRLAEALAATGKPVILVLNQGRPRIIRRIEPLMKGVLQAYLPGNFGGLAVADVLFGSINPSGKLPFTYPMYTNSLVTYDHKPSEHQAKMAGAYDYESDFAVQYPFGFGLSYTEFTYSDLRLSSEELTADGELEVQVTLSNTGGRAGKEVVQLYTSDLFASLTPDVRRLRAFDKIALEPGEAETVRFVLRSADLSFINAEGQRVTEPGDFELELGGLTAGFRYVE